ncbi:uncharacterized protein NPIL_420312 [Nephila pilipes]|uniref:NADH dehydrogenase [ubiquinone] 1 beta subcomplex subunit 11, mitochondrial n=1 Tax=Nephila pilipes TaxID=299642 RepID=A0A8X6ISJ3_NEPPI|nr:uncharacterized protein NPIL_420312 [Nephila pilipes]
MALSRFCPIYPTIIRQCLRYSLTRTAFISTSKKTKDTLAFPDNVFPKKQPPPPKTVEDFADTKSPKSWVSYGFDEENYENDRHEHQLVCFAVLTIMICGGTFIIAYTPDMRMTS